MSVYKVDGWDLNFWFNDNPDDPNNKGWGAQAYPYDVEGEWIGFHLLCLDVELNVDEVAELKLGDPANEYVGGDLDLWADAKWMVADYPHLSPSFMARLVSLPKRVKIVDNELVEVGE